MSFQTGSIDADGLARTSDGKLYVKISGDASITGGTVTGTNAPYVLARSFVAVSGAADTAENTLATITIPANALGANGSFRVWTLWTVNNNANAKTVRVRYSGAAGSVYYGVNLASTISHAGVMIVGNRNATNSQIGTTTQQVGGLGSTPGAFTTSAADTTAATTVVITAQKATGTDTMTLDGYLVEVMYSA